MTYQPYQPPDQPPPVMPGYPAQPPNGDWTPPKPKKRGPLPWLIGAAVVLILSAGAAAAAIMNSGGDVPAAASSSAAAPLPQDACGGGICQTEQVGTVAPAADGYAVTACEAVAKAYAADRLMTTDVLAVEQPARETANADIKAAGAALLDAYRIAVLAKSFQDDDALAREVDVTTAALALKTACLQAGINVA